MNEDITLQIYAEFRILRKIVCPPHSSVPLLICMLGGYGGRVVDQLCSHVARFLLFKILCMTIPLATNTLPDFHMAKFAPCN